MRKFFGGKALAVAAVVSGAVLASVAPVMAEDGADSPANLAVRLEPTAKWRAWGAAIDVEVTYACPAGSTTSVFVMVSQAVLGEVAVGRESKPGQPCTGGFETTTVTVQAGGQAFRWGDAYGTASIYPQQGYLATDSELRIVP
ncbi:hypothetical protein LFM09_29550 [Lentzea alba]|uniref:hypothetical protein n=1 Tax=Lentzea alba TaxID=2714351 RepID=UPI0039C00121